MLRAEILAEGVRDELPQPLVNAARKHKQMLLHLLFSGQQCGVEMNKRKFTFWADEGVLHAFSYRCGWEG